MYMAVIEITGWKDHDVGFTGWDGHAKAELTKRLRRGINASPNEIRNLVHQIRTRNSLTIKSVSEDEVASVRQILETMGAELFVFQSG